MTSGTDNNTVTPEQRAVISDNRLTISDLRTLGLTDLADELLPEYMGDGNWAWAWVQNSCMVGVELTRVEWTYIDSVDYHVRLCGVYLGIVGEDVCNKGKWTYNFSRKRGQSGPYDSRDAAVAALVQRYMDTLND